MFEKCGKLQFSLKTSIQEHLLHVVWSSFVDVKEAINFILMREASFRLAAQLNLETEINRQTETPLWISPLSGHKACSDDCKISVASSVCTSTNTHCIVPLRFFYGHTECQMEILRILQKMGCVIHPEGGLIKKDTDSSVFPFSFIGTWQHSVDIKEHKLELENSRRFIKAAYRKGSIIKRTERFFFFCQHMHSR